MILFRQHVHYILYIMSYAPIYVKYNNYEIFYLQYNKIPRSVQSNPLGTKVLSCFILKWMYQFFKTDV
jgi:hypothetical protein